MIRGAHEMKNELFAQAAEKYHDPQNPSEKQKSRLDVLASRAAASPDLLPLRPRLVWRSIAKQTANKACGCDEIPAEVLHLLPWKCKVELWRIWSKWWSSSDSEIAGRPDMWNAVNLAPVFKESVPRQFSDWRWISLCSTLQKAWMSCVLDPSASEETRLRSRRLVPGDLLLYGFRKGIQAALPTELLRNMLMHCDRWRDGGNLWVISADVKQVFDYIPHELLEDTQQLHAMFDQAMQHEQQR